MLSRIKLHVLVLCLSIFSVVQICPALDLADLNYPKRIQFEDKDLILNGSGFRKVTFFRIKVYALGLYLNEPSSDAQEIMNSSSPKILILKFIRSVGNVTLYDAFEESVQDNYPNWIELQPELEILKQIMPSVSAGDNIEFLLLPESVKIRHNQINEEAIMSTKFQRAVLSIWLGPDPAGRDLKQAILGH